MGPGACLYGLGPSGLCWGALGIKGWGLESLEGVGGSQKSREGDVCCILSYLGHGCASWEQLLPAYSMPPSPHQTGTATPSPTASRLHNHDLQCCSLTPAHSRGDLPTQPHTGCWPQPLPEALGEAPSAPLIDRVTALGHVPSHMTQEGTLPLRKITAMGTAEKSQAPGDTRLEGTLTLTHTHLLVFTLTVTGLHTHIPVLAHTLTYIPHVHLYTLTVIYTYTHTFPALSPTLTHLHTPSSLLYTLTHSHSHILPLNLCIHSHTHSTLTCIHLVTYTYTHSHSSCPHSNIHTSQAHLYTHPHTQTQTHTYVHIHSLIHNTCSHSHKHTHTLSHTHTPH